MRTFPIAAAALAASATPANAATRNFGVTSFEKIRVDGPYKVRLTTGVAPFAKASGPQGAIDRIAMDVRGNTLVVHTSLSWSGDAAGGNGPVEILLGTHDLNTVWLNGSGTIAIDKVKGLLFGLSVQGSGAASIGDAQVDQLNVTIAGTGSASVAGKAGKMTATVRGVSSLDAANLAVKDAAIGAEGTATVAAHVSNSVKVDGNGPLTIRLTGGPACTLRVGGSATVSGCKSTQ
jgi:putative autotransporter adhesin-like protein